MVAVWLTHPSVPCWSFSEANENTCRRLCPNADLTVCSDARAFLNALHSAEIVMVWKFEQEWFRDASSLRWIATPAAGRDYFQVVPPDQVRITYGTFHGELMAETVVGMILGQCRGLFGAQRLQATDAWPRGELAHRMRALRGATVTILGFGHIGEWIGRLLRPFGVHIIGVRRSRSERPAFLAEADRVVTLENLDRILPETDHLVTCLPGGPDTDTLMDSRRLGLLPQHAFVYNVGRGNVFDEAALAAALNSGELAGACLDVFREEPLPVDSPLRTCPNTLLLPHASAIAPNYLDVYIREFARKYAEWKPECPKDG